MQSTAIVPDGAKFIKRDALRALELHAQQKWALHKTFESNASPPSSKDEKYMNGRLHLGHTFTLSKCEFAVGYQRLLGKNTLFPFSFHCTGMPIKACADKLAREIKMFGADFSGYRAEDAVEEVAEKVEKVSIDPLKIQKKHSKAVAKAGVEMYQFQIMASMGVPLGEIPLFASPSHWLTHFPPLARSDLESLGMRIDFRRSFITTPANPYYDAFINWQFQKLRQHATPKIEFGERFCVYSQLDGQACMDHDRSFGEGVGVQEYTCVKLEVDKDLLFAEETCTVNGTKVGEKMREIWPLLDGTRVSMVAATLRPETMYGQTNCFVGVDIVYGVYRVSPTEVFICTPRAARNMAFQGIFETKGTVIELATVTVKAPFALREVVYCLPMDGVMADKGTGIVTSVPSDSPDDYVTLVDLAKKPAYYQIQPEWVDVFPLVPIVQTEKYGGLAAKHVVESMKIQSQKDKKQLAEAKDLVYKEGFYSGTLLAGAYAGSSVQLAKPLVKQALINAKLGFVYCEPESRVVSRTGDECIVALTDQWYLLYGEPAWKQQALACLSAMHLFGDETRNNFQKVLDWLGQWALSRSYGLGSKVPWDPQFLIESLSDSTVYMAYYTIAHLVQGDADGSQKGELGIAAEEMTYGVWEYVFGEGPVPVTRISLEKLDRMRREFKFYYPIDLRDLIPNHLTFFIYNHVALFPPHQWPKAIRANGHLLLNGDKMSKSSGNFLTLRDAIDKFGADATRFALADSGDSIEDANFLESIANTATLRLYTEIEFAEHTLTHLATMRTGALNWADRVFLSEMQSLTVRCGEAYAGLLFREALKVGFYDLQNARNEYRKLTTGVDPTEAYSSPLYIDARYDGMHAETIKRFLEVQSIILSPVCPHWSEHIYSTLLGNPTVQNARWPTWTDAPDLAAESGAVYLRDLCTRIRNAEDKKRSKKGAVDFVVKPRDLVLIVADTYPAWQESALEILRAAYVSDQFDGSEVQLLKALNGKDKRVMPFVASMKRCVQEKGVDGFKRGLVFGEREVVGLGAEGVRREFKGMGVVGVKCVDARDVGGKEGEAAVPGVPGYMFVDL